MNFQTKCAQTVDAIKKFGITSLAKLAEQTGNSKSSTHRQLKKVEERCDTPGAEFFETTTGLTWLRRLAIIVVLIFGLKANIGAPTLALFFSMMQLDGYIASSTSSMDKLKHLIMEYLSKYYEMMQPILMKIACNVSLILGADETFFDKFMILVLMDLSSGFIFIEDQSDNRKTATWEKKILQVSKGGYKRILCAVTDRGKSLVALAKNTAIISIADLFHMQQAVVRIFKFSFARKHRSLVKEEKAIKKSIGRATKKDIDEKWLASQNKKLEDLQKSHTELNEGQAAYRKTLREISIAAHPFHHCTERQTSAGVKIKLESSLIALRQIADSCGINDKKGGLEYFEKNITILIAVFDLWWKWIDQDLLNQTDDRELVDWLKTRLLPMIYWKNQEKKSRSSPALKKHYESLYQQVLLQLENDPRSDAYLTDKWKKWGKHWVGKFQRSSSAVEGRNAQLKQSHHCLRGLSKEQIMTLMVIHNFILVRDDGTTACERLHGFKPPNFIDWIEKELPELATPRRRKKISDAFMKPILFSQLAA